MQNRILVAGSGWLGTTLARKFASAGDEVWALRRSRDALARLQNEGIRPFPADLGEPALLKDLPPVDILIYCAAPAGPGIDAYRKIYVEGLKHVLAAYAGRLPRRLVFTSSTGVYGFTDGRWVDENSSAEPLDEEGRVLLEAERQAQRAGPEPYIIRLGGLYGPRRHRLAQLLDGSLEIHGADRYVNLLHRDDAVNIIRFLLEKGNSGAVYLGVDGHPATRRELYTWLAAERGVSPPKFLEPELDEPRGSGKRCRSVKLEALGFTFRYPTFKEGYRALFTDGGRRDFSITE